MNIVTQEVIFALLSSEEEFPVDLDDAWQWIGWKKKQDAKDLLIRNFEEEIDFLRKGIKSPQGGRPRESIFMTYDCFKSMSMMAGTPKGREVRLYFIECERQLKERIASEKVQPAPTSQPPLLAPPEPPMILPTPEQIEFMRTPGAMQDPHWKEKGNWDKAFAANRQYQEDLARWQQQVKQLPG